MVERIIKPKVLSFMNLKCLSGDISLQFLMNLYFSRINKIQKKVNVALLSEKI